MSKGPATGLEWARQLPRGARIHWAELEAHVMREHRQILSLLGEEAAEVRLRGRAFSAAAIVTVILACLIGAAVIWAPLWGLATLVGDSFGQRPVDGEMAIPVAGLAMIVACVVQVCLLVRRALTRGVGGIGDSDIGDGTVVLGVLTLVVMVLVGEDQQPPGWQVWTIPTILGIFLALANSYFGRRSRLSPGAFASRRLRQELSDVARRQRIRSAVSALPADERERLMVDRQRAIDWLRMQGTITPDEARRANRAELGLLADSV